MYFENEGCCACKHNFKLEDKVYLCELKHDVWDMSTTPSLGVLATVDYLTKKCSDFDITISYWSALVIRNILSCPVDDLIFDTACITKEDLEPR